MDFDRVWVRRATTAGIHHIRTSLTHNLALKVASRFTTSACRQGTGRFDGQNTAIGNFNICHWVQVEGEKTQWVVRFPLVGTLADHIIIAKVNSEVATLKFRHHCSSVRVPRLIGYGLGDAEVPVPFIITEHIEGLPLGSILRKINDPQIEDKILDSLAQQCSSLLSHSFTRIGSLRLTPDEKWEVSPERLPLDQINLSQEDVPMDLSVIPTSLEYYDSQLRAFDRLLVHQRNSVWNEKDARQKYVTTEIFRRVLSKYVDNDFSHGPFFLCHIDVHDDNVLINHKHEVAGIIDLGICLCLADRNCLFSSHMPRGRTSHGIRGRFKTLWNV